LSRAAGLPRRQARGRSRRTVHVHLPPCAEGVCANRLIVLPALSAAGAVLPAAAHPGRPPRRQISRRLQQQMTATVFFAVLAAAAMHAGWNAVIKIRLDRFASISLMTLATAVVSLPVLPFVAFPSGETWMWIGGSLVFHTGYKYFLTRAYDSGD